MMERMYTYENEVNKKSRCIENAYSRTSGKMISIPIPNKVFSSIRDVDGYSVFTKSRTLLAIAVNCRKISLKCNQIITFVYLK